MVGHRGSHGCKYSRSQTRQCVAPLLGSIAHRTGLALDVTYVDLVLNQPAGLTPVDVAT